MTTSTAQSFSWLLDVLPTSRPLHVLNLGAGEAPEAPSLLAFGITLTVVDHDEAAIRAGRSQFPEADFDISWVSADGNTYSPTPGTRFDALVMRRPDISAQPGAWKAIFSRVASWLTPTATVIVSTPGPGEQSLAARWLEGAGFSQVTTDTLDLPAEAGLVIATGVPAPTPSSPNTLPAPSPLPGLPGLSPVSIVTWDDPSDQALVCDPVTGECSPPPSSM